MPEHTDGGTAEHPDVRDYVRWHDAYDDPSSDLSRRLRIVQEDIEAVLDRVSGPLRVLSVCAGQGHDILGVLERRPQDRARVRGALVELDPTNCAVARERAHRLGVDLDVIEADAGRSDTYADLAPADLLLLVGIFGNITPADIEGLVRTAPALCVPGATVLWTRGQQEPDLVPDIRRWFAEAGFEELSVRGWVDGGHAAVGAHRLVTAPGPLPCGAQLFTFHR